MELGLELLPADTEEEDGQASQSTDKTSVTLSDLKKLCLKCGDYRDEREQLYNKDEHLAKDIELVFRFVIFCIFCLFVVHFLIIDTPKLI